MPLRPRWWSSSPCSPPSRSVSRSAMLSRRRAPPSSCCARRGGRPSCRCTADSAFTCSSRTRGTPGRTSAPPSSASSSCTYLASRSSWTSTTYATLAHSKPMSRSPWWSRFSCRGGTLRPTTAYERWPHARRKASRSFSSTRRTSSRAASRSSRRGTSAPKSTASTSSTTPAGASGCPTHGTACESFRCARSASLPRRCLPRRRSMRRRHQSGAGCYKASRVGSGLKSRRRPRRRVRTLLPAASASHLGMPRCASWSSRCPRIRPLTCSGTTSLQCFASRITTPGPGR
mmetsp:Transcript_30817/g.92073  ORF Transcript_30817/g.92073 Transcript_30817/m.92073 type:complete len:288 (-) Transcript_30817:646-1509(-)